MRVLRFLAINWALLAMCESPASGQAHVTKEPIANDGTPVQIDLPPSLQLRNTGGIDRYGRPGMGAGLCVFTSINHGAYFQNVVELQEFQKWMTHKPGGGTPSLVDKWVTVMCKELGVEKPPYLQVQSRDLDCLKLAMKTGRMVSCTYAYSPTGRYGGNRIAHMVNLFAAGAGKGPDGKGWYCVQDNNYPKSYEWMSEAQFLRAYNAYGQGWSVILLNPCPSPVPTN